MLYNILEKDKLGQSCTPTDDCTVSDLLNASSEDSGIYIISKDISKLNLLEINTMLSTKDSSSSQN